MNKQTGPGQPVGPEVDDSQNPSTASAQADGGEEASTHSEQEHDSRSRDMLVQMQQMIDTMAAQAGPVMRDVAAKAAELAAIAAQRAGPIAHRAADATERVGVRVAARTKEMAAELRRQQHEADEPQAASAESQRPLEEAQAADETAADEG
jgi:phosphoglycerate dehydrogenase-like enzyme